MGLQIGDIVNLIPKEETNHQKYEGHKVVGYDYGYPVIQGPDGGTRYKWTEQYSTVWKLEPQAKYNKHWK